MMKKTKFYAGVVLAMAFAVSCNNPKNGEGNGQSHGTDTIAYSGPPYTVQVTEYVNSNLPDLHSYTHGIYKDKIVMFGGRTNGLHGSSYNFSQENTNHTIYVIDTKNWSEPTNWVVHSMPDTKVISPFRQQFRANNAEFFVQNDVLYVIGGLKGANVPTKLKDPKNPHGGLELVKTVKSDDGNPPTGPVTLPYITAINLSDLIDLVVNNVKLKPNSLRQASDSSLAITGGEISVADSVITLAFGWNFSFANTNGDDYSHEIRTFTFHDDGKKLSISKASVCPTCSDGFYGSDTAGVFRRRDGSMSEMIDPANGSPALVYYSGVFKSGVTNFNTPVWITSSSAAEQNFVMRSNVYTCQVLPVYSQSLKMAFATMLGGMTNSSYTGGPITKPTIMNNTNAPLIPFNNNNFNFVPFSNNFTTLSVDAGHNFTQYLLPDSFPKTAVAYILPKDTANKFPADTLPAGSPAFNGAESEMHWTLGANYLFPNGVINYDTYIAANPQGGVIGYLHGGILSTQTNVFGNESQHYSIASNRIFAVKIVPIGK